MLHPSCLHLPCLPFAEKPSTTTLCLPSCTLSAVFPFHTTAFMPSGLSLFCLRLFGFNFPATVLHSHATQYAPCENILRAHTPHVDRSLDSETPRR
jgi:hypothetical protein